MVNSMHRMDAYGFSGVRYTASAKPVKAKMHASAPRSVSRDQTAKRDMHIAAAKDSQKWVSSSTVGKGALTKTRADARVRARMAAAPFSTVLKYRHASAA
jgi:hypothetical protein